MTMHMGHLALRVSDLDRSLDLLTDVLGLAVTERTEAEVMLSANEKHHELQLIAGDGSGLDHVGLEVESEEELTEVAERAVAAGARMLDAPIERGIGPSVRFVGPLDVVYEVYMRMDRRPLSIDAHLKPLIRRFGHLTFFSDAREELLAFWLDGLGFRVSDHADGITWCRCDADHHGLAVGPAAAPGQTVLHHHAWEVQDWGALGQYCDEIARRGHTLTWGPVRHGPGFNLSTYMGDADGAVIEVYTDLLRIEDEAAYQPVDWTDKPRALNLWGPGPGEDLLGAGIPVAPRSGHS